MNICALPDIDDAHCLVYAIASSNSDINNCQYACPVAGPVRACVGPSSAASSFEALSRLFVLISRVPANYDQQPILVRALAFDSALQHLHKQFDLVPVSFREPLGARRIEQWLVQQSQLFQAALERLRGAVQINCRWLLQSSTGIRSSIQSPASPLRGEHDESGQRHATGTHYLRARSQATSQSRAIENELGCLARQLITSLPGIRAAPHHNLRAVPNSLSAIAPDSATRAMESCQLAGVDCLVDRGSLLQAQSYLRACRLAGQSPTFVSDGLPAFAFVQEETSFA